MATVPRVRLDLDDIYETGIAQVCVLTPSAYFGHRVNTTAYGLTVVGSLHPDANSTGICISEYQHLIIQFADYLTYRFNWFADDWQEQIKLKQSHPAFLNKPDDYPLHHYIDIECIRANKLAMGRNDG